MDLKQRIAELQQLNPNFAQTEFHMAKTKPLTPTKTLTTKPNLIKPTTNAQNPPKKTPVNSEKSTTGSAILKKQDGETTDALDSISNNKTSSDSSINNKPAWVKTVKVKEDLNTSAVKNGGKPSLGTDAVRVHKFSSKNFPGNSSALSNKVATKDDVEANIDNDEDLTDSKDALKVNKVPRKGARSPHVKTGLINDVDTNTHNDEDSKDSSKVNKIPYKNARPIHYKTGSSSDAGSNQHAGGSANASALKPVIATKKPVGVTNIESAPSLNAERLTKKHKDTLQDSSLLEKDVVNIVDVDVSSHGEEPQSSASTKIDGSDKESTASDTNLKPKRANIVPYTQVLEKDWAKKPTAAGNAHSSGRAAENKQVSKGFDNHTSLNSEGAAGKADFIAKMEEQISKINMRNGKDQTVNKSKSDEANLDQTLVRYELKRFVTPESRQPRKPAPPPNLDLASYRNISVVEAVEADLEACGERLSEEIVSDFNDEEFYQDVL